MCEGRVREPSADRELDALGVIVAALLGVTEEEQDRIMWYLNRRFGSPIREARAVLAAED